MATEIPRLEDCIIFAKDYESYEDSITYSRVDGSRIVHQFNTFFTQLIIHFLEVILLQLWQTLFCGSESISYASFTRANYALRQTDWQYHCSGLGIALIFVWMVLKSLLAVRFLILTKPHKNALP